MLLNARVTWQAMVSFAIFLRSPKDGAMAREWIIRSPSLYVMYYLYDGVRMTQRLFHESTTTWLAALLFTAKMDAALMNTNLPGLKLISKGKVRDIYETSSKDHLLFVATDRISAYDVILRNVRLVSICVTATPADFVPITYDVRSGFILLWIIGSLCRASRAKARFWHGSRNSGSRNWLRSSRTTSSLTK